MTPEEYQRLKEAEKKHLREIQKIKKAARTVRRQKSVLSALEQLNASTESLLDERANALDKLALDTVRNEARLDIALDNAAEKAAREGPTPEDEAALRKAKAQNLVAQIKLQMGLTPPPTADEVSAQEGGAPTQEEVTSETQTLAPEPEDAADPTIGPDGLPEKTLGRMKHRGDPPS